MKARIYKPARNAMQSGHANTRDWVLEYVPRSARWRDPLMGWTSSDDTARQVRIRFTTKEAAIAFAEKRGIAYVVEESQERRIKPKSYAANFRWEIPG